MDLCNCSFKHDDMQDSLNHGKSFVGNMFSTGLLKYLLYFHFLVSPRRSSVCPASDTADSEFPGQHFQSDLLLLALGSSQKDLFEDDWLDVMVRVYWLKARFLALQVWLLFCFFVYASLISISPYYSAQPDVTSAIVSLLCWQGDMELALESYDVCTGLLQSKPKDPEGKYYTINLPNLRVDSAISVEEVSFFYIKLILISKISYYYQLLQFHEMSHPHTFFLVVKENSIFTLRYLLLKETF